MQNYFEGPQRSAQVWLRFKQEVLLSYRILFGQDQASRSLFRKIEKERLHGASGSAASQDPLLQILCGARTSSRQIRSLPQYLWPKPCRNAIDGRLQKLDEYSVSSDLPLLGHRFLVIQEFNLRQRPRSFLRFWRDKRDRPKWYTFWVVTIVDLLALVLGLVQIALSAAQLYVSLQPQSKSSGAG